jgi:hypothetical protein
VGKKQHNENHCQIKENKRGDTRSMHEGATKVYILMGKVKGKIELERPNSRWDITKIEDFKKSDVRSRIQIGDSCGIL